MEANMEALLKEIRDSRAEMKDEIKNLSSDVKTTIEGVEKFQDFLSGKLDDLLSQVKSLWEDHRVLKSNVEELQAKQHSLQATVDQLEMEVDRINRASIANNMIILGLPTKPNEDLAQSMHKIAAAVGYELPQNAIFEAKRLPSKDQKQQPTKSQPIKVVFSDCRYKEELLDSKKRKGTLLVSSVDSSYTGVNCLKILLLDELTPYGMKLLHKVRDIQELIELKFVWPGRNGAILARKTEMSKTVSIRCLQDVTKLELVNNKRQLNSSPTNTSGLNSPVLEPKSKRR